MKEWNIEKSLALQEKAAKIIPGMTQLLSKRPDMFSRGVWPAYFKKAKGVRVIDLDDNEYIDCSIGGIGATVLGYADDEINEKVKTVIDDGSASTLNPPEEVALAEKLIELHPWAEMARFARSGGEAMSIAVRIARAYTGKGTVLFCGYHGWMDWYLAANLAREGALDQMWIAGLSPNGLPKGLAGTALPFMFNDIGSFNDAVKEAGDDLAAIVLEPQRNYIVDKDFMAAIHQTAKNNDVPLIIDEITAGFRVCNGGAHLVLGWQPDIAVFAKSLGNGYPISAIIGKGKVMKAAQDAFITSTNWTERIGPAAALAMIEKFIRCDASKHMVEIATRVKDGWEELAAKHGLEMHIGGIVPLLHFSFEKDNSVNKAYFIQEMLKQGFLASNAFYAMYAHSHADIDKYLAACDKVFGKLAKLIKEGNVAENLAGKPAAVGFARIN
ncbi:MAG: aminotransferase class III-fold pyridoxal phosphate-dependent enzyme [Lentisphaerae bacterium]|nr:aminotransferase class III-fold pyridoxal phosphate-dependent enzyme [Lentisphaerota bacterium]